MMKKTIGLLAALMITMSSMGIAASGAEFYYEEDTGSNYSQTAADEVQNAIESGNAAAERKAVEKFAIENCDPGYFKAKRMQEEFERNAGGGNEAEDSPEEKSRKATLQEQTKNAQRSYIRYIDDYIVHDSVFDGKTKTLVIDVSQFQYTIDWNAVKADGINYAIIRLGYRGYGDEGTLVTDPYYAQNIRNAKAAGVKVGVYFFTEAINTYEAREEAKYVLRVLNGIYLDMPVYYDIEDYPASYGSRMTEAELSKAEKTELCRAFCKEIENGGYTAGVYSYKNYFNTDVNGPALANEYPVWLAEYTDEVSYYGGYHMWQFASSADVDGISTNVDISVNYGDENMSGKGKASEVAKPTGLKKSGNTISWNAADGATGYEIYLHNTDNGTYTAIGTTKNTSYTVSNPNNDYPYCIKGYNDVAEPKIYSTYSEDIFLGAERIKNLKGEIKNNGVTLTWSADQGATGYNIYRSTNDTEFVKIGQSSTTSYTDTNVSTTAEKYNYYVESFGPGGTMKESPVTVVYFSAGKSAAPVFNSCTTSSITVTWNEMPGMAGYQLLERNAETGKYVVKGDVKADSDRLFTFTDLAAGSSGRYAVRAYIMANGEKKFGDISDDLTAKTTPAAVTGLSYTSQSDGVKLKWNKTEGADKYNIYRKTSSGYKKIGTVTGTAVNVKMSDNTAKQYCVAALNVQGGKEFIGAYSNVVTAQSNGVGQPAINSGVYSDGAITLTWTKTDNVSGYRLYKYDATSKTYKSIKTFNSADTTSYTIYNVQSNITELFKIKAYRREGSEIKWGSASAAFSVKTTQPLAAPTNLYAVAGASSIKLTWDKVTGADLYNVYEVKGNNFDLLGEVNTNVCSIKTTAGEGGKSFVVCAVSKNGSTKTAGKYSAASTVTAAPGTPTLAATNVTSSSMKINWTVPQTASGVRLYMYNSSQNKYVTVKTLSNKKSAVTIKGLSAGKTYKFKAKAYTKSATGISWGKATAAFSAKTSS